jgi:hypothetical protein
VSSIRRHRKPCLENSVPNSLSGQDIVSLTPFVQESRHYRKLSAKAKQCDNRSSSPRAINQDDKSSLNCHTTQQDIAFAIHLYIVLHKLKLLMLFNEMKTRQIGLTCSNKWYKIDINHWK